MRLVNVFRPGSWAELFIQRYAHSIRLHLARTPLIWGDESRVSIGRNVQLVDALINVRSGCVVIEDDVFFGHGVLLLTGKHEIRKKGPDRHEAVPEGGRDITIRRGAWIATGVIVIGPCDIGEDAVLSAGSVVTGTVEASAIYAGNPARLVRFIEFG